jgi:5-methylcytosine-specific restriction endonuclease McrA
MSKRPQTKQQRSAERLKRKARYGRRWDEIRVKVYQRDGNRCRACGKTYGQVKKLNCHHVLLLRVSQTNDTRNLITLCDECHRIVENKGLAMLKRGAHRSEVVRMTYRWLQECKEKRFKLLEEELNGKSPNEESL